MAYYINDECITCGSCQSVCPADAISEGDDKYVIDPKLCTDCGTCAEQCPVEAIVPGDDK
jgi:MinD superfamily P-loop ATPase